ncbi:hypothetical protein NPIL_611311 [Nephila pilipes]|uniref:Uncharacterized protein n=1 Tax=Nephila pilipes TaxID=299642 RepID=A0A8X6PT25_NEPPI|nr:hypothetical protein NPIL_611311 [Nephila pilipes]
MTRQLDSTGSPNGARQQEENKQAATEQSESSRRGNRDQATGAKGRQIAAGTPDQTAPANRRAGSKAKQHGPGGQARRKTRSTKPSEADRQQVKQGKADQTRGRAPEQARQGGGKAARNKQDSQAEGAPEQTRTRPDQTRSDQTRRAAAPDQRARQDQRRHSRRDARRRRGQKNQKAQRGHTRPPGS